MYWDSKQDGASFKYVTEVFGYHPYLSVASSALGYLLFAVVIVGSHKKGILKKYVPTVFLILAYSLAIDIFETGQTLYFIFNMPDQNPDVAANRRANGYNIVTLPTTVWACTLSQWLFAFHYVSSVFVDAIVSIHHFIVRFCGKNARVTTLFITFGIFIAISICNVVSSFIFGEESWSMISLGPIVCRGSYNIINFATASGFLSCVVIAFITPIFPILTLIKGAAKKHNETGLTTFLLLSSLPAVCILICFIIGNLPVWQHKEPKLLLWIFQGLFALQQFRFSSLCFLATLIVPELRGAMLTTIADLYRLVFKRDISVTINIDLFHLETGEKKHIEKKFTI